MNVNNKSTILLTENEQKNEKYVKCVVWDLDNTIWNGTLIEDDEVVLRKNIREIINEIDNRGILQSIASKNNYTHAIEKIREFDLDEYFIFPQISWAPKSKSVRNIAEKLNIGIDTLLFIDDQQFELDEITHTEKSVMVMKADEIDLLLTLNTMNPRFVTDDSKNRRKMYIADIERKKEEENFSGPNIDFLASLKMELTIGEALEEDLQRAEELTVRTNQLNTTGYTYSYGELNKFRKSQDHILLIAGLEDRYGSYGKIGLVLIETSKEIWNIKLLLMSCRVMSRGVGSLLINYIRRLAKNSGVTLTADMISNDRNKMMYMTYKFLNFKKKNEKDNRIVFQADLQSIPEDPPYVKVIIK